MKNRKLALQTLKVSSFVTQDSDLYKETIKGGGFTDNSCQQCSDFGCTRLDGCTLRSCPISTF